MLKYRIPGQSITSLSGRFIKIESANIQGFTLIDFNKENNYIFQEGPEIQKEINPLLPLPYIQSKEDYLAQAKQVIETLKSEGDLEKIVFSRIKQVEFPSDGKSLFYKLESAYPKAFVYYFKDPELGEWIGASPEVLVQGENEHFSSVALAGTKKAEETNDWGDKEKEEQAFVSRYLVDKLRHFEVRALQSDGPKTIFAGPLAHLRTDFHWQSHSELAWKVAQDLHPTPAVSGTPVDLATKWILQEEKHARSFYAGIIGERQAEHMNLYVNLRCAQIIDSHLYLYLGGGFTSDSDPEKEWEETENKSKTLLNLL